jgi:hypothetical protein
MTCDVMWWPPSAVQDSMMVSKDTLTAIPWGKVRTP